MLITRGYGSPLIVTRGYGSYANLIVLQKYVAPLNETIKLKQPLITCKILKGITHCNLISGQIKIRILKKNDCSK